jgi:hypothetical protein
MDPHSCVGQVRNSRSYIYIVCILCVGLILPGVYLSYGLTCIVITQQQNTRYKKPCIHRMFYTYISTCLHNDRFSACRRLSPTQDVLRTTHFRFLKNVCIVISSVAKYETFLLMASGDGCCILYKQRTHL